MVIIHSSIISLTKLKYGVKPVLSINTAMLLMGIVLSLPVCAQSNQSILTLDKAISFAIEHDPWLQQNQYKENAVRELSVAAKALPDPIVSLSIANLPTNGWDFNQEPMTQLKAGLSQTFPRGDSQTIQSLQQRQLAEQYPYLREDRRAKIKVNVSELWLDAFLAQASIQLIEESRVLFEQLNEVAQANYSSAVRQTRQQDVVRANLELIKINDRLLSLQADQDVALEKLQEWIRQNTNMHINAYQIPTQLPPTDLAKISFPSNTVTNIEAVLTEQDLHEISLILNKHPFVLAIEQKIHASHSNVALAKQKYKPQWSVNASYAYRADDELKQSRADFISVGVSFDLPLFTENRQDKEVSAKVYEYESMKTEKQLVLRSLLSGLQANYAKYKRLQERKALYENEILVQMTQLTEVSLSAYVNDEGSFSEVVQARIAELNTQLAMLKIEVDLYKSASTLNYYFTQTQISSNTTDNDGVVNQ